MHVTLSLSAIPSYNGGFIPYTFSLPSFFRQRTRSPCGGPVLTKPHAQAERRVISSWFAWVSLQAHIIRLFVPRHERTLSVRFTASQTLRRHNFFPLPEPPLIQPCRPSGKIITVRDIAIYMKTRPLVSIFLSYFFLRSLNRGEIIGRLTWIRFY